MNRSLAHRLAKVILSGGFFTIFTVAGSAWYYGGFSRVQSALRGQVICVEPTKQQFPTIYEGHELDARFSLLNLSSTPCEVIGTTAPCNCDVLIDGKILPVTLAPHGQAELQISVTPGKEEVDNRNLLRTVELLINLESSPIKATIECSNVVSVNQENEDAEIVPVPVTEG
ncbi:hypothetical protein K2X85_18000 [bacterium]|nr:hypothetical protein [bacterium]